MKMIMINLQLYVSSNRMYKSLENLEKISSQSIMNLLRYESPDVNQLKLVEKLHNSFSPSVKNLFRIDENNQNWY